MPRTTTRRGRARRTTAIGTALALGALALGACGGSSSAGGDEGIAKEINIAAVHDLTGPVAYAGVGANKGARLAIEEINEQGFLGDGVTLTLEDHDTAGEIERASSEMTKAMSDRNVSVVLGPTQSQQAAAVAPLVEKMKVPTVFTQAGAEGVVVGDYTFRATAPMESYYSIAMDYLADQGYKNIDLIYNATFPTFAQLGEDQVPAMAKERGMTIDQSLPVQMTTQDFTSQAQKIAGGDSDAVVMLLIAPQSVTFLDQLRSAGYDGQVAGTSVQASGNIAEAGDAATGTVYPVDYAPAMPGETSKAFTKAFTEMHGEEPDAYAAEGYDAVWWIARGIKESGSSSREGIQEGMAAVAEQGFTGAMGELTFEGNDMRVPGVMIEWTGSAEQLAK